MPPREPKARLLTREYVADRDFMVTLTPAEREWYLLTSLFADDAGYLEWDLPENAANVYRFDAPKIRDARVARFVEKLGTSRIEILPCGRHAVMPRVAKRPRSGGREYAVRDEHDRLHESTRSRRKSTESPPESTTSRLPVDGGESGYVLSSPVLSSPLPSPAGAREDAAPHRGMELVREALAGTPLGDEIARRKPRSA